MRKLFLFPVLLSLVLSGCAPKNNSATEFLLNTVVNIKANASSDTLNGAFSLAREYENLFSRTIESSEISQLNSIGELTVSDDTAFLLSMALEYSQKTNGKFDITIGAVSPLWDFNEQIIPKKSDVEKALRSVGYEKVKIDGNHIKTNGAKLDLGAVAKGYIADKVRDYLNEQNVNSAVINFGGNVVVMGDDYSVVGIKNPFEEGVLAKLKVKNTSVVTSGTYERTFTKVGKTYHHILDTKTGYPADTDLVSATIICKDGTKADILSTCCLCLGLGDARELIEKEQDAEAIFVTRDGEIFVSSGIYSENGYYLL
ncbi:MAG: FAD:protein FMN transferase [Ruminococcaceae bacterium]|nr:FAD:protein FMN transferase [Oscillospiraceae bacterium]